MRKIFSPTLQKEEITAQLGLVDSQCLNQHSNSVSLAFVELCFSTQQKTQALGESKIRKAISICTSQQDQQPIIQRMN